MATAITLAQALSPKPHPISSRPRRQHARASREHNPGATLSSRHHARASCDCHPSATLSSRHHARASRKRHPGATHSSRNHARSSREHHPSAALSGRHHAAKRSSRPCVDSALAAIRAASDVATPMQLLASPSQHAWLRVLPPCCMSGPHHRQAVRQRRACVGHESRHESRQTAWHHAPSAARGSCCERRSSDGESSLGSESSRVRCMLTRRQTTANSMPRYAQRDWTAVSRFSGADTGGTAFVGIITDI